MAVLHALTRTGLLVLSLIAAATGTAEPYVFTDAWTDLPAAQVTRGGFLRFPYGEVPRTFNPLLSLESNLIAGLNTDPSLGAATLGWRRPDDGTLEPRAAESWTISDDGLTLDVELRPELRWSDGTPITAKDYQTSFDLQQETDSLTARLELWTVESGRITLETTGERTLRFTFPGPDRLGLRAAVSLFPVPDHVFGEAHRTGGAVAVEGLWGTDTPPDELVFSGFMRLADLRAEERMILERNPYFGDWNVDAAGQPLPYVDGMSWTFMSPDTALTLFLTGELDGIRPRNLDDLGIINAAIADGLDAVVVESAYPIATTYFITFNWNLASDPFKQELFRDRDFRRAVAHLIDRETIIDLVHAGAGFPLTGTVHPMLSDWYHDELDVPAYDPDAALALLEGIGYSGRDAAGYLIDSEGRRPGFTLVVAASTPFSVPVAAMVADSARAAGLDVRVQQVAFPLLVDLFASAGEDRGFEAMFLGFSVADAVWPFPDPVFACDGGSHVFNRSGECLYPTERLIDELVRRGRVTLDDDEARRIGHEIQELDLELGARIFVTVPAYHYVGHGRLAGEFPREMWNAMNGSGLFFLNSVR